ncbi:hypothetical protein K474DRAFT_484144 [Panus rudis PR-1116 ss-1]|nr:hypothetical protein K474DRAFT_484144 [Panus rudis PR-1116 ss-1]
MSLLYDSFVPTQHLVDLFPRLQNLSIDEVGLYDEDGDDWEHLPTEEWARNNSLEAGKQCLWTRLSHVRSNSTALAALGLQCPVDKLDIRHQSPSTLLETTRVILGCQPWALRVQLLLDEELCDRLRVLLLNSPQLTRLEYVLRLRYPTSSSDNILGELPTLLNAFIKMHKDIPCSFLSVKIMDAHDPSLKLRVLQQVC